MLRPAVIFLLAILAPACSLMPPKSEHLRARQMEDAVLPMAATALEAGQVETARRLYVRLLDIDSESVQARMGLGDIALREREAAAAVRWYLAALAHAEEPPQRHAALLAHGRAALAAGQLEAARKSFARLTKPKENAPRASVAWGHNGVGLALLLEGDLRGAVNSMEQAVLRAPEEERFQGNLNRALAMLSGFPPPDEPLREFPDIGPASVGRQEEMPPVQPSSADLQRTVTDPVEPEAAGADVLEPVVAAPDTNGEERIGLSPDRNDRLVLGSEEHEDPEPEPGDLREIGSEESDLPASQPDPSAEVASEEIEESAPEETGERSVQAEEVEDERSLQAEEVKIAAFEQDVVPMSHDDAAVEDGLQETVESAPQTGEPPIGELETSVTLTAEPGADVELEAGQDGPLDGQEPAEAAELAGESTDTELEPDTSPVSREDVSTTTKLPIPRPRVFVLTENSVPFLQFGAYAKPSNADTVAAHLRGLTDRPVQISDAVDMAGAALHRVRIGPFPEGDALLDLISVLEMHGYSIANPPRLSAAGENPPERPHRPLQALLVHENGEQFLQAGAYSERTSAAALAAELRGLTERPVQISEVARTNGPPLHRVRVGPLESDDPLIELFDIAQ